WGGSAGRAEARRRDEGDVAQRRGLATKQMPARRRAPAGCGPQARWLCCSLLTYRPGYSSSLAPRQRAWGPAAKCEVISARALSHRVAEDQASASLWLNTYGWQKIAGEFFSTKMKEQPLRTTVVGSYPFPGWLEFASQNLERFGAADVEELIEDAVTVAVQDQVQAGLDVITDGEQTRLDFNL